METVRIVGIDPALRNTGLAVATYNLATSQWQIEEVELIQTENQSGKTVRKSSDDLRCAQELVNGINRFIKRVGGNFACAEVPTGTQSARGAFSNGVCCGVLASVSVPIIQVSPTEVKLASVGKKTASKDDIIQWAGGKWPHAGWKLRKLKGELVMVNDNEHMADACAAIAAGVETVQFAQAMAMMAAVKKTA